MAKNVKAHLSFAWTGDFESLKQLVGENLKLVGFWSQPGGDKKVFSSSTNVSITWRKNKNSLTVKGEGATNILKELFGYICDHDDEQYMHNFDWPSSDVSDVKEAIENLRVGQLVNAEAVQALADSISHISSEISALKLIEANFHRDDIEIAEPFTEENTLSKQQCQTKACVSDNANSNDLSASKIINACKNNGSVNNLFLDETLSGKNEGKQSASCSHDNPPKQIEDKTRLSTNGPGPTMVLDVNCRSDQSGIGNDLPSYADVATLAASISDKTKTKCSSTTSSKLPRRQPETKMDSDDDGFIGVQRKRNKIKNFFVSGISTSVNEEQITRYLQNRNITPTYISTFQSKRKGTISSKIHIPAATSSLVLKDNFWPQYVTCKPWRASKNSNKSNSRGITHSDGKFSTFV